MTSSSVLLAVRQLSVRFAQEQGGYFSALKQVSFDVPHHCSVALVGESGSGKSVSAMSIMRLLPRTGCEIDAKSEILFEGQNLLALSPQQMRRLRGKSIGMIFQEPMSSLNPVFSVGEQISEVLRLHMGLGRAAAKQRTIALLEEVGLPEPEQKIHSYPHQLSGGQQQRVMIAMAIACEPKLLIADEPTTALDVTIQKQILELIKTLQQKRGMSVLFITHDLDLVREFADQVLVMREGEVREQGSVEAIFNAPQHPYTKALLACRPRLDSRPERLAVIEDFLSPGDCSIPLERERGYQPDDAIVLDVQGLCKSFPVRVGWFRKQAIPAIQDVSFKLARGKTLGIVGESGSGKTTVGLSLVRLYQANAGKVLFDGQDLLALSPQAFQTYKRRIQIIFQNPYASLNPRFNVEQILTEPMLLHHIAPSASARRMLAQQLLDKVGLPSTALSKYPHEFSGGQRQRIAIARCLSLQPEVLICDESVSALDVSVQAQVLNLLQDLQDELKLSYLFISHDLAVVKHISDQVLVMQQGKVVEQADADGIYLRPQQAYTQQLLAAIPGVKY